MTEPEGLTAVLLQLSGLTQRLSDLDHRQASDTRQIGDRVTALAAIANDLKAAVARHDEALAAIERLDRQLAELAAKRDGPPDDPGTGYQPAAMPRLWKLAGADRADAVARLRAWVDQVYRPGYGYLSADLADCWDQHPLCLYILDWLSELWSVMYLQPARTTANLAGQAEWHTRLLPTAASQLTRETGRCSHATTPGWTAPRP